jgi:peptidyl-prolyl cis-trans isomerase SurA
VRGGEAFEAVAREVSEDGNRAKGGEIGLRPASRLPDAFVEATRALKPGESHRQLLRTGAGFHVLKLIERQDSPLGPVTQTRARHVLLRTSPQLTREWPCAGWPNTSARSKRAASPSRRSPASSAKTARPPRVATWAGRARCHGPEFETAMNALPLNGLSAPVVSRFGVHLIQVLERREVNAGSSSNCASRRATCLREQRFEQAYLDWTKELRARAYVEMREPPQ